MFIYLELVYKAQKFNLIVKITNDKHQIANKLQKTSTKIQINLKFQSSKIENRKKKK